MISINNSASKSLSYFGKKRKISFGQILLNIFFICLCVIFIYPVLLTVSVSFSDDMAIANNGYAFIPEKWSLAGYKYALKNAGIARAYLVTIMSSSVGTVLSVLIMMLYAYPLSRRSFKHRTAFALFAYFSTFLSGGLVPWYIICTQVLKIGNTFWALVLPSLLTPTYIIILRTFISTNVPNEMIEATKIDGAGEWRIFWQFVIPLSKPGIATIALFQLLHYWNDYYLPMMLVNNVKWFNLQYYLQTLFQNIQVLVSGMMGEDASVNLAEIPQQSVRMAMCVLTMGPILIVYPFFQRFFVKGLTVGSVKG